MKLGQLAVLNEKGIFYVEDIVASQERFSSLEKSIPPNPVIPFNIELPNQYQPTVVNESTTGEYITGVFKDQTDGKQPYEVILWVLIESEHPL